MKVYKGIYYFPTYASAVKYCKKVGLDLLYKRIDYWIMSAELMDSLPRINEFEKGWAIQFRKSGPYVGKVKN
jgi:hypothetical protein